MASARQLLALLLAGLFPLSFFAAIGGSSGFLVALFGTAGLGLALYEHDAADGEAEAAERGDEADATDRSDEADVCSACGELVPAGKRRCEDCAVVGSWRK